MEADSEATLERTIILLSALYLAKYTWLKILTCCAGKKRCVPLLEVKGIKGIDTMGPRGTRGAKGTIWFGIYKWYKLFECVELLQSSIITLMNVWIYVLIIYTIRSP